jgi:hypothetical protein
MTNDPEYAFAPSADTGSGLELSVELIVLSELAGAAPAPVIQIVTIDPAGAGLVSVLMEPSWFMAAAAPVEFVSACGTAACTPSAGPSIVPAGVTICTLVTVSPKTLLGTIALICVGPA